MVRQQVTSNTARGVAVLVAPRQHSANPYPELMLLNDVTVRQAGRRWYIILNSQAQRVSAQVHRVPL
jgi:hypothetical protein